jgi:small subunit ribosomal protein S1
MSEETVLQNQEMAAPKKTAHDDFNWNIGKRQKIAYTPAEIENYRGQYDATLSTVSENEIVKGIVTSITGSDAVLDINYKSDGLVPLSEFRDMPDCTLSVMKMVVDN